LLGAALALLGIHAWGYLRWGTRATDLDPSGLPAYRIDLNRADRAELLQLPGVGPKLADRIEEYRRDSGGFRSVDDLHHVRGIDPATVARLRAWVCVGDAADEPDGGSVATRNKPSKQPETEIRKSATGYESIDVNKATPEELRKLPGIGPKLSQAIVDERTKAPFKSVEELRRVHGIGPKTLDRLRPYVTVGSDRARVAARE
jgi:competence protein ComEA